MEGRSPSAIRWAAAVRSWSRARSTSSSAPAAAESEDVRAVVITGAGKAFCPGLDMAELERVSRPGEGFDNTGRRPVQLPALVPKPVVAAINGACAGLGFITALASDIRIAAA